MDRDQAKFVLSGFRSYEQDHKDPCFTEALKLVDQDPELRKWFENEVTQDQIMASGLRTIEPPSGLREAIFAGGKLDKLSNVAKPADLRSAPEADSAWRRFKIRWGIAAAAVVLLLIGLGIKTPQTFPHKENLKGDFGSLLQETALQMSIDHSMQISMAPSWALIKDRLEELDYPITQEPPSSLQGAQTLGCQTLEVGGRSVSLICFVLDNKNVAHLFLAPLGALDSISSITFTGSIERQGYLAESWTDKEFAYCLVFPKGNSHLTM